MIIYYVFYNLVLSFFLIEIDDNYKCTIKKKSFKNHILYCTTGNIYSTVSFVIPPIELSILSTVVGSKIRVSFCSGSAFNRFCVLFKPNKRVRGGCE